MRLLCVLAVAATICACQRQWDEGRRYDARRDCHVPNQTMRGVWLPDSAEGGLPDRCLARVSDGSLFVVRSGLSFDSGWRECSAAEAARVVGKRACAP